MNNPPVSILVIGYGSLLRSDDAVGRLVADAVAGWDVPGVRVISQNELTPELAEPLAAARLAIFVDARVSDDDQVRVDRISPEDRYWALDHACAPAGLLSLALAVFGSGPSAWLVAVPATDFEVGESLSAPARLGVEAALAAIRNLVSAECADPARAAC